jgi:hypothetical protein
MKKYKIAVLDDYQKVALAIWMELDDAKTIHLKRGDIVVQNGTRHAWRNNSTAPLTMLFFLNGAKPRRTC